jgi:hypothetical protein
VVFEFSRLFLGQLNGLSAVEFCRAFCLSVPHHETTISHPHKKAGRANFIGHFNLKNLSFAHS